MRLLGRADARPTVRPPAPGPGETLRPRRRTWGQALRRDWQLYSLALLPLLFFAVFRYLPMLGNVIAFRRYQPGGSLLGEYWVGLRYVEMFLNDPTFWRVFTNTLVIGGLTLLFCYPLPIVLALLLNEVRTRWLKGLRPGSGPASISRTRPCALRWSARAVSSAASRPRRFISWTVRMTRQCGAWALISRASARAASNCGRTRTRVEIFSEKILSRPGPCAASASSCDCSSWVRVLHRAYPIRMSAAGVSAGKGAGGWGARTPRLAGVSTRSSLLSRRTLVNRPVWYDVATAPDRDRHGEPGCALTARARVALATTHLRENEL